MVKVYGKPAEKVTQLLREGKVTIDVVGIGNMGLPVAVAFAKEGAKVVGVRTKQVIVDQINRGECPIEDEPRIPELLKEVVAAGRLRATTDGVAAAREADVIILLVPLLVDANGREDYSIIQNATQLVGKGIMKGALVITSTTLPPGATEHVIKPILEAESGMTCGKDFGLAHSPERLMVGFVLRNLYKYPKVVGGIDEASREAAAGVYSVFGEVVRTTTVLTAEIEKVAEGTYRDINIAFANFLAKLCEPLGVNAWEVISTANAGVTEIINIHRPSAGVGGHCIPIYPWFFINKAKELGIDATLVREARFINDHMPHHTVDLVIRCLNAQEKSIKGSRLSFLGISFRVDAKETRLAASLKIRDLLKEYHPATILAHDPLFSKDELENHGFTAASLDEALKADCIILTTPHTAFNDVKEKLRKVQDRLIDTANFLSGAPWQIGHLLAS